MTSGRMSIPPVVSTGTIKYDNGRYFNAKKGVRVDGGITYGACTRRVLYCIPVLFIPVPAAAGGSATDALVSFFVTFLTGIPVFLLFLMLLWLMRKEICSLKYGEGSVSSRRLQLVVVVIRALVLVPLFPVVIFCLAHGPSRGESAVIVSALFGVLLALSVLRVAVSGVAAVAGLRGRYIPDTDQSE